MRRGQDGRQSPAAQRQTLRSGLLIGVGLAGTLDEVLLHQLLHWHHFYDRATPAAGLVSDGLFHLVSTLLLGVGLYQLWHERVQPYPGWVRRLWAGICSGAGGFNLYDATIQHKLLRLHQVRPDAPNWLPYDLAFGGVAVALLIVGLIMLRPR